MLAELGNVPYGPASEGELTDPADNTVIADSGAVLATGVYEVIATVGASAAADVSVQRRTAANDATTWAVVLKVTGGNQSGQYRFKTKLLVGERVRIAMDDALTGTIAAAVNLEQFG